MYTDLSRLMMEKYDGIRVFWDGKYLRVKSSGITVPIPQDMKFPTTQFEGVLW
jgi:hypothetical protein